MSNKPFYGGMTVNERLFVAGLLDRFEKAVKRKDKVAAIKIFEEADLDETNIETLLKKYGLQ